MLRRRVLYTAALAALGLLLAACGMLASSGTPPTVTIGSPANGATVPLNQPVMVNATASDPDGPGIGRVELAVNGVVVNSYEAVGAQNQVATALTYTPTTAGAIALSVTAYDTRGTAGTPAVLALTVGAAQGAVVVQVTGGTLNIYSGPIATCPLVAVVANGQQLGLLAHTSDGNWWQVSFNQRTGWVRTRFTVPPGSPALPVLDPPGCAPAPSPAG